MTDLWAEYGSFGLGAVQDADLLWTIGLSTRHTKHSGQ